jgi:adenosine/AMP kinase
MLSFALLRGSLYTKLSKKMKQFKFFYWRRYGDNEKDCDTIVIEALSEASARHILKQMIPSAYDINLLK